MDTSAWTIVILIFVIFYLVGCYRTDCCVDSMRYGTVSQSAMIELRGILRDDVVVELFDDAIHAVPPAPSNCIKYTLDELRLLQNTCHGASEQQRGVAMATVGDKWMDELRDILTRHSLKMPPGVENILKKTSSVVMLFKIHYGRPRPRQLGDAVGIPVYAMDGDHDNTPSYVSRGVTMSRVAVVLVARAYPGLRDSLFAVSDRVVAGRQYGGWHYPSDCIAGITLADFICSRVV